jgi:hypothetical protein
MNDQPYRSTTPATQSIPMSKFRLAAGLLIIGFIPSVASAEKLASVFNGKDFAGWKVPADSETWFQVADGQMKIQSGPEKKGKTLWTEKEYKNFVMEFDFKFGKGTVDTGIFIRNDKEQIQIGISGSLKRDMTGSPYIAGKGYPVEAKGVQEILKLDDWNEMTIVAKGKNYTVWLNGKHVMSYDSESAIEKGPIGIQLHGGKEMACEYRKIRLSELN